MMSSAMSYLQKHPANEDKLIRYLEKKYIGMPDLALSLNSIIVCLKQMGVIDSNKKPDRDV
jgi:hypothetical protein